MSSVAMKYEDWLRGCVHHDGRKGNVYLPCDTVLAIADWIEAHRDAAPVRHGRWLEYGENKDGTHNIRCSKCGAGLKSKGHANSYYTKRKYRYCRNCGTKMDEVEDND